MITLKESAVRAPGLQLFQIAVLDFQRCYRNAAPDDKVNFGLVLGAPVVDRCVRQGEAFREQGVDRVLKDETGLAVRDDAEAARCEIAQADIAEIVDRRFGYLFSDVGEPGAYLPDNESLFQIPEIGLDSGQREPQGGGQFLVIRGEQD